MKRLPCKDCGTPPLPHWYECQFCSWRDAQTNLKRGLVFAWGSIILITVYATCCTGCTFEPQPGDCYTTQGMRVFGTKDCTELSKAQAAVETVTGKQLPNYYTLYVWDGSWPDGRGGETRCDFANFTIKKQPLAQSAFFHEAMHVLDNCATPNHEGWNEPGAQRDTWVKAAQLYEEE